MHQPNCSSLSASLRKRKCDHYDFREGWSREFESNLSFINRLYFGFFRFPCHHDKIYFPSKQNHQLKLQILEIRSKRSSTPSIKPISSPWMSHFTILSYSSPDLQLERGGWFAPWGSSSWESFGGLRLSFGRVCGGAFNGAPIGRQCSFGGTDNVSGSWILGVWSFSMGAERTEVLSERIVRKRVIMVEEVAEKRMMAKKVGLQVMWWGGWWFVWIALEAWGRSIGTVADDTPRCQDLCSIYTLQTLPKDLHRSYS